MSNKSRRKRRQERRQAKRKMTWFGLALGGTLAAILVVILVTRPWSEPEPEMSIGVTGEPRLSVDQSEIDEGYIKYDVPIRTTFRLSNVGDQPLKILEAPRVSLVEGCWPPKAVVSSTTINPGQQAVLTMDYTMPKGMGGPHEFHVRLQTNDPVEPEKILVAKSDWGP